MVAQAAEEIDRTPRDVMTAAATLFVSRKLIMIIDLTIPPTVTKKTTATTAITADTTVTPAATTTAKTPGQQTTIIPTADLTIITTKNGQAT